MKKNDSLDDIMLQALLLQRTAFIELLVMNGFVMKNFLTVEKLAKLYNEAVRLRLRSFKRETMPKTLLRSLFTDQEVQGTQHTTQANLRH